MDFKTYYYLKDEDNILHVCSDGFTRCGKDAKKFVEVEDAKLKLYELCAKCQLPAKAAKFIVDAEIVDGYGIDGFGEF